MLTINGRMKAMRFLLLVILIAAVAVAFDSTVSLGGLLTSGNSELQQLDAGLEITGMPSEKIETGLVFLTSYGSQSDVSYLEKYFTEASMKYSISSKNYAASRAYWFQDEFSGVNYEYGASAGLGRELITVDDFTASLEVGAGYLSRENTEDMSLETATWYSGLVAEWIATDTWTVSETARITGDFNDSENYYIGSLLEANSAITGSLSFSTGFEVTHYNLPPVAGNEKTDTALRVQLRYKF